MGFVPAGRFAGIAGDVEPAGRRTRRGGAKAAEENPQAKLLMTQPGVGPSTALAYVLTIGDVSRFPRGKQVAVIWD
jgi:transposase